jgi:hypothetical protein
MRIIGVSPVVENVFVNGKGPFIFLVDTGAETNVIDPKLARQLKIESSFHTDLKTAAGATRVDGGRAERISLGAAEAPNQTLLFASLDSVHALSPDIRGILGQEFLSHFDYTLDFLHRRIAFGEPSGEGTRIPVRSVQGRMMMTTSLGELVLDSGAGRLVLFRSAPDASAAAGIQTSSGMTASVSIGTAPELKIGDHVYRGSNAVFGGTLNSNGTDGLLPASLFHAIFICNSNGYIVIDPQTGQ